MSTYDVECLNKEPFSVHISTTKDFGEVKSEII